MRYPNVTWRISSYMITYLPLYHTLVIPVRNIFLSKSHLLRIMDVSLRKAPSVSLRVIIHFPNFYHKLLSCLCLPIHKIYALCVVYLARFLCYWRRKTLMNLKSGFRMGEGHWKLHQRIAHVSFLIPRPYLIPFVRYSLRRSKIAVFCYPSFV